MLYPEYSQSKQAEKNYITEKYLLDKQKEIKFDSITPENAENIKQLFEQDDFDTSISKSFDKVSEKENELMDEYFSRINYSNVNFKTYTDGWKSDMGMIYVLFGPPDDLEVYNDPLSRMYQQRWHYYRINKFFDFVDENGFGD